MVTYDVTESVAGDAASALDDYSVDPVQTDGASGSGETTWNNVDWGQQLAYYKKTPRLKSAINAIVKWSLGKGYTTNPITEKMLLDIKGNGKSTFLEILKNQFRTAEISGDSYAHIIRDKSDDKNLINLKPLDPDPMTTVANPQGIIIRYEQRSKVPNEIIKFKPEDIFHLMKDPVADEMHGESMVPAIEQIILSLGEAMADTRKLMHRHVVPQIVWKLKTDVPAKVAEFKAMQDAAYADRENIYVPMDAVEREVAGVPPNATLSSIPWIELLNDEFSEVTGVPAVISGGSKTFVDGATKVTYLAWEQTIRDKQKNLKDQVLAQLNIEIEPIFPASLLNDLLSGAKKDGPETAVEPNDLTAEVEGPV